MLVCIEAWAGEPTAIGRRVTLYAYTRMETAAEADGVGDTVRDANRALEIVRWLVGGNIVEGRPPGVARGHVPLWVVQIQVSGTRRGHSSYRAAYHKCDRCPLAQIDYMMEIYHAIKRVLRSCRDDLRREREAKKEKKGAGDGE